MFDALPLFVELAEQFGNVPVELVAHAKRWATPELAGAVLVGAIAAHLEMARTVILAAAAVVGAFALEVSGYLQPAFVNEWFYFCVAGLAALGVLGALAQLFLSKGTIENFLGGFLLALLGLIAVFALLPFRLAARFLRRD